MYSKESILKSLMLAPMPLLIILSSLFILGNMYGGKGGVTAAQIPHILLIMGLVWLIYCILTIPIAYPISILLQRKNCLNIWTTLPSSVLVGWLVLLIIQLVFTRSFPTGKFDLESIAIFSGMALFSGLCYWLFLKLFHRKQSSI